MLNDKINTYLRAQATSHRTTTSSYYNFNIKFVNKNQIASLLIDVCFHLFVIFSACFFHYPFLSTWRQHYYRKRVHISDWWHIFNPFFLKNSNQRNERKKMLKNLRYLLWKQSIFIVLIRRKWHWFDKIISNEKWTNKIMVKIHPGQLYFHFL